MTRRFFKGNKSKSAFIFYEEASSNKNTTSLQPHGSLGSYRTFSEVDLQEILRIKEAIENHQKPANIDLQLLTCLFEGHSIFSLF